jgi:hypothetical protein
MVIYFEIYLQYSFSEGLSFVTVELVVYRRILGPVYDNEKKNWRILTNKEIYAMVKNPTITETVKLNRLRWFGHVQRMEENRFPRKSIIHEFGNNKVER